jgi:hypothetical protein
MSLKTGEIRNAKSRKSPWQKGKIGRERPHFFAAKPPKSFVGSLPPCGTSSRAGLFATVTGIRKRRKTMPIVKKAPGLITREVKLEEPVNQLLEDYARFIESSTDHVINSVLKKLWRDQDYRKWRDARRTAQPAVGGKTQATEQGVRS